MPRRPRDRHEIREAVLLILGCGIFVVWSVTYMASVFFDRPFDSAVHGIMLATVTSLFGGAYLSGRKAEQNGSK